MAGWGFKGILYSRAVRNDLCVRGRFLKERGFLNASQINRQPIKKHQLGHHFGHIQIDRLVFGPQNSDQ
jgi:hypothetical protein